MRWIYWSCVLPLALAAASGVVAHEHAPSRGRLVFSDYETAIVRLLDLDTGEVTHRFDVPKPGAAFSASADGRFVFVVTGDAAGTIAILDTGIVKERHGDHTDVEKRAVRMLNVSPTGERPSHVTSGHGWASFFYDGPRPADGGSGTKIVLLDLASLDTPRRILRVRFLNGAQHGIAVPLGGNHWAVTEAKRAYVDGESGATALPNGLTIYQAAKEWKAVASFHDVQKPDRSCKELHGHASLGNVHVFGCNARIEGDAASDGGLFILSGGRRGPWRARKLDYPDARRAGTILSREGGRYLIANYGRAGRFDALLRINPEAAKLSLSDDVFPLPDGQPVCQFALSSDGSRLANLLPDGTLRVYSIAPVWKEVARFDAVAGFDCSAARIPRLSVIGRSAFLSDPENRRIREYDLTTLKQGLDISVDGVPARIAPSGTQ